MRICVTGSEGYLGSLLAPELIRRGHEVVGLDTGYYKEGTLYRQGSTTPMTIAKDLRQVEASDLRGVDAVVHMAELSNDPLGQLAPNITYDINHAGSVRLAELARQAGVTRFVYMSSCSVYGVAEGDYVSEQSPVNPQTAYAICKTRVERDVKPLAGAAFSPTFMRNATAYGASPHMRFDIVLNNLAGLAWTTKGNQDDERRHALAAAGSRAGHCPRDSLCSGGAARGDSQRDLQCWATPRTTTG